MTSMGLFSLTANFWCGPRPLPHSLRAGPGRGLRLLVGTLGLGEYPRGVPFTALGLLGAVAPPTLPLDDKGGSPSGYRGSGCRHPSCGVWGGGITELSPL